MTKNREIEIEFLKESNAIEGVFDDDSLKQAIYAWDWLKQQTKMTVHVVCKTHKILMLHQPLFGYQRGYFRDVPVWVGGREGVDHTLIWDMIAGWGKDVTKNLTDWKEAHIIYERIHPFVDGNGRTGRMFMNWQRLRNKLPILVIHAGKEQQEYYNWFK